MESHCDCIIRVSQERYNIFGLLHCQLCTDKSALEEQCAKDCLALVRNEAGPLVSSTAMFGDISSVAIRGEIAA